jgi:hypothetical protein
MPAMDWLRHTRPTSWIAAALGIVIALASFEAWWLWTHEKAVESVGFITVAATLALALAAVLTIRQNDALIKAAIAEATAATEQARTSSDMAKAATAQADASSLTVAEMQMQRQLANRPWIVVEGRVIDRAGGDLAAWGGYRFAIKNIGTGPAVNVCLSATQTVANNDGHLEHRWMAARIGGISAGGEWQPWLRFNDPDSQRYRCLTDDLGFPDPDDSMELVAIRYEDWFGNYYLSANKGSDLRPTTYTGEPTAVEAPNWMRCS